MTDREKLIGLLYESDLDCNSKACEECDYLCSNKCKASMMADHLLTNGVTFQKWIPVTERLPEKGVNVIALGSRGGVYTAKYKGSIYWHKLNARNHMCEPTHWMPLPEPPANENV